MCIEIPPKYAVAFVIGFLKGKSAIAIARTIHNKARNYTGMHFWARGYTVSTGVSTRKSSESISKIRTIMTNNGRTF